ncbi:MAG: McrB family protein [Elusimicrobiota bacterium]
MLFNSQNLDDIFKLAHQMYPKWSGFCDERFVRDELSLKQDSIWKARELLNQPSLLALKKEGRYSEILDRFHFVGRSNADFTQNMPSDNDLFFLRRSNIEIPSVANAFYELVYGEEKSHLRIEQFQRVLAQQGIESSWTVATYFLVLCSPSQEFYVNPIVINWFFELTKNSYQVEEKIDGELYRKLLGLMKEVQFLCRQQGEGEIDLWQVQALLWVAYSVRCVQATQVIKQEEPEEEMVHQNVDSLSNSLNSNADTLTQTPAPMVDPHPECVFGFKTFNLLKESSQYPSNNFYLQNKKIFLQFLEKPFEDLVLKIHDRLPRDIQQMFRPRPIFRYGIGEMSDYYLATFSCGDRTKRNGPELFFSINGDNISVGYNIEYSDASYLGRFKKNVLDHSTIFERTYKDVLDDGIKLDTYKKITSHFPSAQEISDAVIDPITQNIRLSVQVKQDNIFRFSEVELSILIADMLSQVFSFMLFIIQEKLSFTDTVQSENKPLIEDLVENFPVKSEPVLTNKNLLNVLAHEVFGETPSNPRIENLDNLEPSFSQSSNNTKVETEFQPSLTPLTSPSPSVVAEVKKESPLEVLDQIHFLTLDRQIQPAYSLSDCSRETGFDMETLESWIKNIDRKGQIVFSGPSGTGKTFMAEKLAKVLISGSDGMTETIQLHPSYTYEQFLIGKGDVNASPNNTETKATMKPGRFFNFCREAAGRSGTCVLILDEIHRSNLAQILGETLFLLENRNREMILPGGQVFHIPSNVKIIGTMNSAESGASSIDPVVRRRFAFIDLMPRYDVLKIYLEKIDFKSDGLIETLKEINDSFLDKKFAIGISPFMQKDLHISMKDIWTTEIEPIVESQLLNNQAKINSFKWNQISRKVLS